MPKVCQYLKMCPKRSHYAQLCSHLSYAQNYVSIIRQGLATKVDTLSLDRYY